MLSLARIGKGIALSAMWHLGALRSVLRSNWRTQRLMILCYHGVSIRDEHEWHPALYIQPEILERRLRTLREHRYEILDLEDGLKRLYSGDLPKRSIVITFDDGGYDFYHRAFPILSHYHSPATVYLTSFYSDFNRPVFPGICSYLLWRGRHRRLALPGVLKEGSLELESYEARASVWKNLMKHTKDVGMSAVEKDELAARLASAVGVNYGDVIDMRLLHLMNAREVRQLAAAGIDFQLHTHRHRAPLEEALFSREILQNREKIQQMTGKSARHFCYPSGEMNPMFFEWLRRVGVKSAVTCEAGIASASDDRLALPRFQDGSQVSDLEFEAWVTGFVPLVKSVGWRVPDGGLQS